jgi:1-acyl-sn-glycerol-3-phosphate acyltransferase
LEIFAGTKMHVIGTPPKGPVLVASKHMSMWDTLALYLLLDDPGIVLKRELLRIPFYGWYLWKNCAIAIDRSAGADAMRRMTHAAAKVFDAGRPILIFPEGTRKKPGAAPDYKPGVAGLYAALKKPCVPVALDSGVYWCGFFKYPGTITVEFLEPVPPGLKRAEFMRVLESRIEQAMAALLIRKQPH